MMNGSTTTELPADVRSLFTGASYASLATVLPDGSPRTAPRAIRPSNLRQMHW